MKNNVIICLKNGYYEVQNITKTENIYIMGRLTREQAQKAVEVINKNCTCKSKEELCQWCNGSKKINV